MVSEQIRNWAQRFVFGNDSDFVQKHIKLLAESGNSQTLLAAIEQAVKILNRDILENRHFGHDNLANDKLPLVNEDGFFLRFNNGWKWVPADYESVIQLVVNDVSFHETRLRSAVPFLVLRAVPFLVLLVVTTYVGRFLASTGPTF